VGVRTGFGARIERAIDLYAPFAGLAIGTVITALTPFIIAPGTAFWIPTAGLVLAAATWSYVLAFRPVGPEGEGGARTVRASDPRWGAVYVVGLVLLMAVLVHRSPWYAFLAIGGYAHSFMYLRGRWRFVGMTAVAVLHAYSTVGGGLVQLTPVIVLGVTLIAALIAVVSISFTLMSAQTSDESERRGAIIEELNATNRQLAETLDENAALQACLVAQAREAGILDERARMAAEIHDTLAQGLTGIVTQLEAASASDADARRHLGMARSLARESLTEARRSVEALTPGRLDDAQLPDAITGMAKAWAETSGAAVHVETHGDPRPLVADIEVALFRVAQEALANVGRHAGATRVGLTLSYMDDVVVLDVRDDGRGFDPAAVPAPASGSGFGLVAMEQRVRRVSGTLALESAPGEGTAVGASVPAIAARPEEGEQP
jgi:signal transduction histidine kinase